MEDSMDSRKLVIHETLIISAGVVVCALIMLGVCALLGHFGPKVILGAVAGSILSILNFFFMALGACEAADVASGQNVKRGKSIIKVSYAMRMAVIFVILFALVKSGACDLFTSVIPLAFVQPVIFVTNFFRK